MIEKKDNLIYRKLERQIPEMNLASQDETQAEMSPEAKKYFDGFRDRVISIKELDRGLDSTVFMVKLGGLKERSQVVKVYEGLKSVLAEKKEVIPILKKYFKVSGEAREFLKKNNNPLQQKIDLSGKEYSPCFSIASHGILVEKNGEVGSWIRHWVPKKNFSEDEAPENYKEAISSYVGKTCQFLSSELDYNIRPSAFNYKVFIKEREGMIEIVFTDLTSDIRDFVKKKPHTI